QPDHPKKMIGVKMRKEDLRQRKAHPVTHHLALGALAAFEQQRLAFAHQGHRGDVALHGGPGGRSTEKSDRQHGAEYSLGTILACSALPCCSPATPVSSSPSASATSWPCSTRPSSTSPYPTWRARSAPASPACSG